MADPRFAQQKAQLALQYLESNLPNYRIGITMGKNDRYYNIFPPSGAEPVGGFIFDVKKSVVYRISLPGHLDIEKVVKQALAWAHEKAGARAA